MSGKSVPNGPCSNDVEGEAPPCKPVLEDTDDEPPLSTQEIDFNEADNTSSAPSQTVTATGAADEAGDQAEDGAVDANSDANAAANTVNDANTTLDTVVELPQTDAAEVAVDNSSKPSAQIDTDKEDMPDADKIVDAGDGTNEEVEVAAVDAVGELQPDDDDTSAREDSKVAIDDSQPGADDTSAGAAETGSNPDTATDAADDSKAVVDNTTAETKNDADAEANVDLVAGDADNSKNPDAAIDTDEEQKAGDDDVDVVADMNNDGELLPGANDTSAGAADTNISHNTATDAADDSKAVVGNTTAETKNDADADAEANVDLVAGDADNSKNLDAAIETDEGQKAGDDDVDAVADVNNDGELLPGANDTSAGAADTNISHNTAIDAADDSKAVVDSTTAETKNDADAEANVDLVAGDADNSKNLDAAIETDEEQKTGGDNTGVDGVDANHDAVDDTDEEQKIEGNGKAGGKGPGTVTDESVTGNEAVETAGSNVSVSTTTDATAEDNFDQVEADVESGSTYETPGEKESSEATSGAPDLDNMSEVASDTADVEDISQTLYTSPDSTNTKPDDAVKVLLKFDYDLTTASNFNSDILSVLEENIAKDLAGIYGLIATSTSRRTTSRRRYLRKLTVDDIMALDSNPVDVNVANAYECQENDPNLKCTPISGFMTAYLRPGSDEKASKAAIISHVEQGMESGTYLNNQIIKTSFIGTRSKRDDETTAILSLKQQKALSGDESSLVIGLSVFFLGFAALVGFVVLHTRKKKRHSNNSDSSTAQLSRNTIGVDFVQIAAQSAPAIDKYDNNVGSATSSSSGDEEDQKYGDLKYGITEDYGDLVGTCNEQDITQVHPGSCLAVIESCSDLDEIGSFETGTPRTSPRNDVPADSNMPNLMSPLSTEGDLLGPELAHETLSPVSTTEVDMFRMISPATSMVSYANDSDGGMLDNETVY